MPRSFLSSSRRGLLLVLAVVLFVVTALLRASDPPTIDITLPPPASVLEDSAPFVVEFLVSPDTTSGEQDQVTEFSIVSVSDSALVDATAAAPGLPASAPTVATVTVTPKANASGTATITVRAVDALGDIGTRSFTVTIDPVNDPPSISDIADQVTGQQVPIGPLAFTVADIETAAAALAVTATSSNQALVPDANLAVGGADGNRTLILTPATGESGTTTITVTVGDGVATASDTFVLTVQAASPPTITPLADASIAEDAALAPVPFTVADPEGQLASTNAVVATSSDQALVPNANLAITGGPGVGGYTVAASPLADQNGATTITVTVTDHTGLTAQASFVLTVTAVDDPPVVTAVGNQSTAEDTPAVVPIVYSDVDTPLTSPPFTISAVSSNDALVPDANLAITGTTSPRTLTITPVANQSGTTTITVTVSDGTSPVDVTFDLTVTDANDAPVVAPIADTSTLEDTATVVSIVYSDIDSALTTPPFTFTVSSSNTTLVPNSNLAVTGTTSPRTLTITPAADQSGTTMITVTADDGAASSAPVAFTLTVTSDNDPPTLDPIPDQATNEDTPRAVPLTVGDPESVGAVTVTALSSNTTVVDAGGLVVTGTGASRTLTITPVANASGTSTITVSAVDDGLPPKVAQQTFLLTVNAVDDSPVVATLGPQSTPEDTPLSVDVAYSDVDSALTSPPFTFTATSSNTALVPNANLSLAGNGSPRTLTITPVADQTGTTTITVTASDGTSSSAPVSFVLTVTGVNDAPVVSPIADMTSAEDTPKVVSVIYDDPDTPLTSVALTLSSSNTALVPDGNLVLTGSGSPRTLTITPAAHQSGTTVVTVVANDGVSSSAPVTFQLVVSPVNDPPTLAPIGPQSTPEDTAKIVSLTVGDPDPADVLTVTATSSVQSVVADAGLTVTGSGTSRTLAVTPAANASGTTTITVTVTDNGTPQGSVQQSFVLTVDPANDAPSIGAIGAQTVNEDTATGVLGFTVSDIETDPGSLVVTAVSDNVSVVPNAGIVLGGSGANRTVVVTPAANASGAATITLTVADLGTPVGTASISFVVTVNAVNDPPTISAIGDLSTSKGVPTAPVPFTVGDVETPGALTVSALSSNQAVLPDAAITLGGSGAARTITLSPPVSGQTGPVTITVTVSDGSASAQETFVLTVNPPDAPTITPIPDQTINEDGALAPLAFTVDDPQGSGASSIVSVTAASSNQAIVPNASVVVSGTGGSRAVAVTPLANTFTTAIDTVVITVTVTDHTGLTAAESFQLNVTAVNDAPTLDAIATPQATAEDTVKTVALTVGDVDPSDVLTVAAVSSASGVVANAGLAVTGSGASRVLTVTPVANASGTTTITVTVTDNASTPASAQRQFVLNVAAVNDSPTIVSPGNRTINEDVTGGPYTVTIGDVETAETALTLTASSSNTTLLPNPPATGITLGGSGANRTITVKPATNQSGTTTVTLTVSDGTAQSSTTFGLTVTALDDPPTLTGATTTASIAEDGTFTRSFTVADVDTPLASVTVSATSDNAVLVPVSSIGVTGAAGSRTVTITPAANESGTTKITVTASDATGTSAPRQFTLNVTAVNDAPTMSGLGGAVDILVNGSTAALAFTVGDIDESPSSLVITAESDNPALVRPGGLAFGGSGTTRTLTVTPDLNQTGAALITVTVADNGTPQKSVQQSFPLTVNDVACAFNPTVSAQSFPSAGGGGVLEMDASRGADALGTGCAWALSSSAADWLVVASPGNGFADGALSYTVAPNLGTSPRTAALTVAGQTFTITQAGAVAPCVYTLESRNVPATGGAFTLAVTASGGGCPAFSVAESEAWLSASVASSTSVSLLVAANTNPTPRSGTVLLTWGGSIATATISQVAAGSCTYIVTPDLLPFGSAGGQRSLGIDVPGGCGWAVAPASAAAWVTVAPDAGFGQGGVIVSVGSNDTGAERAVELVVSNGSGSEVARVRVAQDSVAGGDADGDGLPSQWEAQFGLDSLSGTGADGALGDPDGDGMSNLQELRNCDDSKVGCTHPRGFESRFMPEGAQSGFFDTRFALLNPSATEASVLLRFQKGDGTAVTQYVAMPPLSRRTVAADSVAGLNPAEFATVVEADQGIVVDRTMTWDQTGYGSHAETGLLTPRTTWYLAEGATIGNFDLFYLVQNPSTTQAAEIRVEFLLPSGPPVVKAYTVNAGSRFNIWVNTIPELANVEVSAVISVTNGVPVLVERAMYLSSPTQLFAAGHESAAVAAPATEWFLAEGATGSFFDLFVLVANPQDQAAQVQVDYLLSDGTVITKPYTISPRSRFNIWVDLEDPRLASADVSTVVRVLNGVPVIVERAMWWPGPTAATWSEAHNSAGTTRTAARWALAEGEQGGAVGTETYVLVANTSAFSGQARLRLVIEDGSVLEKTIELLPLSRRNVPIGVEFPEVAGKRFGVVVEALGATPAQLVVERAMYASPRGVFWAAGTNALATPLP